MIIKSKTLGGVIFKADGQIIKRCRLIKGIWCGWV